MRKLLLLAGIFGILSNTFAQNTLLQKIAGGDGLSKQFTKLEDAGQVSFDPGSARSTFGLNANSNLVLMKTETDKLGLTHYRYYQTYRNIPVENSMYLAHTKNGKLNSMSGTIITQFDPKTDLKNSVSLSPARAISAALNYVHAAKYAWQDAAFEQRIKLRYGNAATYYPVPSKVWYGGDDQINPANLTLAYRIDVYTLQPLDRKFIYVDAKTGKILGTKQEMMHTDATGTAATGYSGTQTIHSDLNGGAYRLRDLTKGNGIITLHASGAHADYTNATANWSFTTADKWALDAHFGVAATWTFYKDNFNRNSVDNAGYALTSWVNDATTPDNAFWDGSEMDFGNLSSNGNGVTAIDVTGHELTHGVTQYTCNLVYSREPGAMNESMSDIMGKSVQFYTKPTDNSWIMSNDMGWEIRSFSNPNADGQPDTYKGLHWATARADNFGVHTNSGVGNFMFYLLVNGGSGTNDIGSIYTVNGIGLQEAGQILYRTETVYLTSTSQYADWRTACINAATDLYGATSNQVIQVKNAWYAVGIGTAGGTGTPCDAPTGLSPAAITNTSATINWTPVTGATGYTLQWKLSSAGTFTTVTGLTSPAYNLTGLVAGTSYQVQVSTGCGAGSSAYSAPPVTFTTTGTAPCTIPTGMATGTITSSSAVFSWATITGAAGYNVQYRAVGGITWAAVTSAGTSYGAGGLTANTNYEWQVQTVCSGSSSSAFTTSVLFKTLPVNTCQDILEPNNTLAAAAPVTPGVTYTAQISASADKDYYSFSNTTSLRNIKVTLTTLPFDYDLRLYKPNGTLQKTSQNGGTTSESIVFNPTTTSGNIGKYTVNVYGYNSAFSNTKCYTLNVQISGTKFFGVDAEGIAAGATTIREAMKVYPVPASDFANLSFNAYKKGDVKIAIVNQLGQEVMHKIMGVADGMNFTTLNVSKLTAGFYIVRINNGKDVETQKLIISK